MVQGVQARRQLPSHSVNFVRLHTGSGSQEDFSFRDMLLLVDELEAKPSFYSQFSESNISRPPSYRND